MLTRLRKGSYFCNYISLELWKESRSHNDFCWIVELEGEEPLCPGPSVLTGRGIQLQHHSNVKSGKTQQMCQWPLTSPCRLIDEAQRQVILFSFRSSGDDTDQGIVWHPHVPLLLMAGTGRKPWLVSGHIWHCLYTVAKIGDCKKINKTSNLLPWAKIPLWYYGVIFF